MVTGPSNTPTILLLLKSKNKKNKKIYIVKTVAQWLYIYRPYISQKSGGYPTSISYLLLYKKKIKKIYKKKLDGFTTVATSDGFTMQPRGPCKGWTQLNLFTSTIWNIYIYYIYIYINQNYIYSYIYNKIPVWETGRIHSLSCWNKYISQHFPTIYTLLYIHMRDMRDVYIYIYNLQFMELYI